jgi:chemotaxis protein CheD
VPTCQEVLVRPGGIHFGGDGALVRTLLGSCVAITLWHPRARLGGMCHFVVPTRGRLPAVVTPMDGRYGDEAMQILDQHAWDVCTTLSDYEVTMYGGGNQFAGDGPAGTIGVAARNAEAARRFSEDFDLRVVTTDLGGWGARHILLDLSTGVVTSRRAGLDARAVS